MAQALSLFLLPIRLTALEQRAQAQVDMGKQ